MAARRRSEVGWEEVPEGLLMEIADRVERYEDFEAVKKEVCSMWSSALRDCSFRGKSSQVPLLMLYDRPYYYRKRPGDDGSRPRRRLFYSLSKGRVVRPSSESAPLLDGAIEFFSSKGWLLVVCRGFSLFLFNPISCTRIPLPGPESLDLPDHNDAVVMKFILSDDDDFSTVVLAYNLHKVAFWRSGDQAWTQIRCCNTRKYIVDLIFSGGKLYVLFTSGEIMVSGFGSDQSFELKLCLTGLSDSFEAYPALLDAYLLEVEVESKKKKLWVIAREIRFPKEETFHPARSCRRRYRRRKFRVMEFDMDDDSELQSAAMGVGVELHSLGNRCLFLGKNHSFYIEVGEHDAYLGCRPNCIFFTESRESLTFSNSISTHGMGVFYMADGTTLPLLQAQPLNFFVCSLWVQPRC